MGRAVLALMVLLTACAGPRFTKPGVSAAEAQSDLDQCAAAADQANRRENAIEDDILASRGRDWQNTGTLGARKSLFAAESYGRARDVIRFCMQAKGYAVVKN